MYVGQLGNRLLSTAGQNGLDREISRFHTGAVGGMDQTQNGALSACGGFITLGSVALMPEHREGVAVTQ